MQVKLAILADYANITAEGKLNILGVFDRIHVGGLPAIHPQMQLILRLEAHAAERERKHVLAIRLHTPDGRIVFDIGGEVLPRGGSQGQTIASNQIIGINNLELPVAGEYNFAIFVDNDLKLELPLVVEMAPRRPTGNGADA